MQSEYLSAWDRRREYVSGFSGSNGVAVVTATRAALWTDGRYVLQADDQLDCHWALMEHESMADWLRLELPENASAKNLTTPWSAMGKKKSAVGINLKEVSKNLVDIIWTSERPKFDSFKAFVHNESFSGMAWTRKVELVREVLRSLDANAMVVTSLEEVAWLFNIRGYDIEYMPVVRAYAILSMKEIYLFINESKLPYHVKRHLRTNNCFNELCVRLRTYENILKDIRTFCQQWTKVLLPAPCVYDQGVSRAVYTAVHPPKKRFLHISPILLLKAKKNNVESYGMRAAHIRDAVAFCDFMAYFEKKVSCGLQLEEGVIWTEMTAAKEIDRFRGEQRHSKGPSFTTIAGYGPNGALPHYVPTEATNLVIGNKSTFVLDSGGQYLDGTTDVTRTLHFGTPTDFQKEVYTRVLMGSIQLAALVFPVNVKMTDVDVLARGPLWEAGLDYDHGTGHGIGSFLGVHESPINILYDGGNFTFQKGYFFSDGKIYSSDIKCTHFENFLNEDKLKHIDCICLEPGYYEEGQFGVRLENILEVEERPTKHNRGEIFYGFRPVTLIPYEPKLMNTALLSKDQRDWLNYYNSQIRLKVGAELKRQRRMRGFHWMMSKTGYIPNHCSSARKIFDFNYSYLLLSILVYFGHV
ncbi:Xaa-Pro aminopeptidase 1 [Gryllus bimaculatus]|nr:Xaa-Pro aminopeptidase 1 [Gryllus bimaculatus]